jgi:hypothetical protein
MSIFAGEIVGPRINNIVNKFTNNSNNSLKASHNTPRDSHPESALILSNTTLQLYTTTPLSDSMPCCAIN